MIKLIHKQTLAVLCSIIFFFNAPAVGQEAKLTDLVVSNTRDNLIIYCKTEGAFTEKMEKAIISGVPVSFSFFITLYEVRNLWPDKKVTEKKITHSIKYNNMTKEYTITRSLESGTPIVTKTFEKAQKLMSEIDNFILIPLNRLKKGKQYQIRSKAELMKMTLPFYLHYVLFFVAMWDFETEWHTIDFIY
ncbi:hypothetical protein BuS5_02689 [Desulfosarcina sp. BuS5]|uniref:DUF4390 domain-containing protein n=1 Tax=Desulfosarcina sp. BuS5 TaxID=933262 RepID=UPI0005551286|nr:DUF4390 domain-containing protein [Desulfosarcina sp. BuS5]WDN89721.1 hypothetical protein BuS5_02689 [Desulfosarcina sp. BuS5]